MIHIFLINHTYENEDYLKKLRKELTSHNSFRYFIFNIKDDESCETVIKRVLKYLNDDSLRFYVAGDTSILHRVINAIDGFFDKVEIAWLPVGERNAFINNFNDVNNSFLSLDSQIKGHACPIDYIRTNHGIAINTISCGVDTSLMKLMDRVSDMPSLSRTIHIQLLTLFSIIYSKAFHCGFEIDNGKYLASSPKKQFFFGNGAFIDNHNHKSSNACINDGLGEFFIDYEFSTLFRLRKFYLSQKKGNKKHSQNISCQKLRIISEEPININMDGILYEGLTDLEAKIVSNQLMFVIPATVSIKA